MASLDDEDELIQMVRDYIESEATHSTWSSPYPSSMPLDSGSHRPCYPTLQEILRQTDEKESEVLGKILSYVKEVEPADKIKRLVVMRLKEDGYNASLCKTSWATTLHLQKALEITNGYEYIEVMVMVDDDETGRRLIVDLDFRSQFEVARPTLTYRELTDTLPSIFVGTEEKLSRIITLICSAAKESMKERGLHVPPWRKASFMQSKWLSKDCKKVSVSP